MAKLEDKTFLEALKTNSFGSEKKHCKQCDRVLSKSYEIRYDLCDRCQSPDDVDWEGTEDDSIYRKKRTFEYVE